MNKILLIIFFIVGFAYAESNMNIIKECNSTSFTNIKYELHKQYKGEDELGLQYGLKNSSADTVKYSIVVYEKDKQGNRIHESIHDSGELKANYEKPFSSSSYYPIGVNLSSFGGDIDVVLSCAKITKKEMTSSEKIILKKSAFSMFKNKSLMQSSIEAGIILKYVDKIGGLNKLIERGKKGLK